jgi:hypothetical protein
MSMLISWMLPNVSLLGCHALAIRADYSSDGFRSLCRKGAASKRQSTIASDDNSEHQEEAASLLTAAMRF